MPKQILAQQEHPLTADTKLVVSHGTWRKKDYVDVRTHWRSPAGEWFPTKKGVRLGVDLAIELESDLARMLGVTRPKNGNGTKPGRNGRKRDYAPIHVNDSTFPNRKSWPKNKNGGLQISPYPVKRTRHDGVRCYGEHRGKDCIPFDFSKYPSVPQATWRPWTSRDQNANDKFARDVEGKTA